MGYYAAMKPFIPAKLPIESIDCSLPELIAALGEANRALAAYDALIMYSPNPKLLIDPLVRREALFSSRIEGSQSTLNEVFQFDEEENSARNSEQRDDLNEIKNYVSALKLGESELGNRRFSLNLLKTLHQNLLGTGSVRGKTKNPGSFRIQQNWIGRIGANMQQATFVPPPPLLLTEYMENWENFYHSRQPDALLQAAVMHAQFELIHPFEDGNGRLGRLLVPLFLYEKEIIARPNFYPSAYLEAHRDEYMSTLRGLNRQPGDWNTWALFFLKAMSAQAKETSEKVKKMLTLYEQLKPRFIDLTHSQFAVPMLDAMFESPIFRRPTIEKKLAQRGAAASGPTTHNLLRKLVEQKILEVMREGRGRRGAMYRLTELMEVLDE